MLIFSINFQMNEAHHIEKLKSLAFNFVWDYISTLISSTVFLTGLGRTWWKALRQYPFDLYIFPPTIKPNKAEKHLKYAHIQISAQYAAELKTLVLKLWDVLSNKKRNTCKDQNLASSIHSLCDTLVSSANKFFIFSVPGENHLIKHRLRKAVHYNLNFILFCIYCQWT